MKRILSAALLLFPILLSACSKEPPSLSTDFTGSFSVTQDEICYQGDIALDDTGLVVTMTEPYTVSGVGFRYDDEGLSIEYAGHKTTANCDYIPPSAIPQALHNALAYLPQAAYCSTENGADVFTLPTPYGDVAVTAKDGTPITLSDSKNGLEFTFTPDL